MKAEPPADFKCRDKFLVQTVLISAAQELPDVSAIVCLRAALYLSRANTSSGRTSRKQQSHPYRRKRSVSTSYLCLDKPDLLLRTRLLHLARLSSESTTTMNFLHTVHPSRAPQHLSVIRLLPPADMRQPLSPVPKECKL